jgi:hypothetical protein
MAKRHLLNLKSFTMPAEIKDWEIKVRTTYHNEVFEDRELKTLAALRQYFTMFQSRGKVWGYVVNPQRPHHWQDDLTTKVVVCLCWTDEEGSTTKEFSHLLEFMLFLHENKALAKCVQYKPKFQ